MHVLLIAIVIWLSLLGGATAQFNGCPAGFCPAFVSGPPPGPATCTGGASVVVGGNTIFTFTGSGTLTCSGGFPAKVLVVAGGGGAMGGGGGAGGYCTTEGTPTCGLGSSVTIPSGATAVTVGAGGAGGTSPFTTDGSSGSNSVLGLTIPITATGGGGGGHSPAVGVAGGSGGGGGIDGGTPKAGGAGSQGNNGGTSNASSSTSAAGGGGGAGAVGGNASFAVGGNGGNGVLNSITGAAVTYAGGGGGAPNQSTDTPGTGGSGGGGSASATMVGSAGTPNTGGGGGGSSIASGLAGGAGGSGVVIISCATTVCTGPGFSASCMASSAWISRTSGLSTPELAAYDTMICGMIADGNGCSAWSGFSGTTNGFDVFYFASTGSTTVANLNLCSASFGLTLGAGSPTFTADHGYTGDGTASYFNTGYTPGSGNFTQNSAAFGACVLTIGTTVTGSVEIQAGGSSVAYLKPVDTGPVFGAELNGGTFPSIANTTTQGMYVVSRTGSGSIAMYKNQTSVATPSDSSTGIPTQPLILMAYNSGGSIVANSSHQDAAWFMGGGLTPTQVAQVSSRIGTAVAALSGNPSCVTPTVASVSPNSGSTAGGTSVAIGGTGYGAGGSSVTAIAFGANPAASFSCSSSIACTATSPAGSAGIVHVTVTTSAGTSTTSGADQFTYGSPACGGYQGAGDIVSGAVIGVSIQAWDAAHCGTKVANICVISGSTVCADMLSSASTGLLVPQTINGTSCPAASTSACQINIWYDQTASGACSGSCNMLGGTVPLILTTTCPSPITVCALAAASGGMAASNGAAGNLTNAIPFTGVVAAVRETGAAGFCVVANFASGQSIDCDGGATNQLDFSCDAVTTQQFNAVADGTWHSLAVTCPSGNYFMQTNGTSGSTQAWTPASQTGVPYIGYSPTAGIAIGIVEYGVWQSDKSSSMGALYTNEHARFGF